MTNEQRQQHERMNDAISAALDGLLSDFDISKRGPFERVAPALWALQG